MLCRLKAPHRFEALDVTSHDSHGQSLEAGDLEKEDSTHGTWKELGIAAAITDEIACSPDCTTTGGYFRYLPFT